MAKLISNMDRTVNALSHRMGYILIGLVTLILMLTALPSVKAQDTESATTICVVDSDSLGSQKGKGYIGSSGDFDEEIPDAERPWGWVSSTTPMSATSVDMLDILLLIIDDFSSDTVGGTTRYHGDFVEEVVNQAMMNISGGSLNNVDVGIVNYAEDYDPDLNDTTMENVPTLATVVDKTIETINTLSEEAGMRYDYIILNMSWVILGCEDELKIPALSETPLLINIPNYFKAVHSTASPSAMHLPSLPQFIVNSNDAIVSGSGLPYDEVVALVAKGLQAYAFNYNYLTPENLAELGEYVTFTDEYRIPIPEEVNSFEDKTSLIYELLGIDPANPNVELNIYSEAGANSAVNVVDLAGFIKLLAGDFGDPSYLNQIVPVAAAGNFSEVEQVDELTLIAGNTYSALAPASWRDVLAISGSIASNPFSMWPASNHGQLMAPAAWYNFVEGYLSGTSFATPVVSAFLSNVIYEECIPPLFSLSKTLNAEYFETITDLCFVGVDTES